MTLQDKDIFIEHRKIFKKIFDSLKKVSYFCKTIQGNGFLTLKKKTKKDLINRKVYLTFVKQMR